MEISLGLYSVIGNILEMCVSFLKMSNKLNQCMSLKTETLQPLFILSLYSDATEVCSTVSG